MEIVLGISVVIFGMGVIIYLGSGTIDAIFEGQSDSHLWSEYDWAEEKAKGHEIRKGNIARWQEPIYYLGYYLGTRGALARERRKEALRRRGLLKDGK